MSRLICQLSALSFLCYTFINITPLNGQDCIPSAVTVLDINNVRATIPHGGGLWWDYINAGYKVPKDHPGQVSAIFAGGIWVGGLDPGGNIKLSETTYSQPEKNSAGPLINGAPDPDFCKNFNRHWIVNKGSVESHIADFDDDGIINAPKHEIMAWPGRGNPESVSRNGFDLPDVELAPFVDLNGNGIYEPMSGEYPKIKGDRAVWWMFNTDGLGAVALPPQLNVSVMAYGFKAGNHPVNWATFYDVKVVNVGAEDLLSTYIGLWVDPDLGCFADDYIGSAPDHDMGIVYNADAFDGDPACEGLVAGYGEEVPMLGFKFLKGATNYLGEDLGMTSFMYYNNGSVGNPPPPPGASTPFGIEGYYNLLKGVWPDGTPLTIGGDGYMSGGDVTTYAYSGDPSNMSGNGWSMCDEMSPEYDRRILMSSGPFDISPDESNEISIAVIFTPDQPHPCPGIHNLVNSCELIELYLEDNISSVDDFISLDEIDVFPNPFNESVNISFKGNKIMNKLELHSADGKLVHYFHNINSHELIIKRNNLPNGIYFFKAFLNDGKMATGKIIAL